MIPSIIAIDGPAASGKSTLGALLAEKLGYIYFDTGVMYRAVTWAALERGLDIGDEAAVTNLAERMQIDVLAPTADDGRQYTVMCEGRDVTWAIRTPEVDRAVSPVSAYPGVRTAMTAQQRRIGLAGHVVMVGRDIGTVVLPEADLKIYLDASAEERACRRQAECLARGEPVKLNDVLSAMMRRDQIDSGRATAPLRPAQDAVIVDSTHLDIAGVMQVVEKLLGDLRHNRGNLVTNLRESMAESQRDIWSEWLLNRRFGGNAERMKAVMDCLYPVQDKVLHHANLGENETLLDVGCGDGLIAFGAFEKSATVKVIFSDISQDLLNHAQAIAQKMDVLDRCHFICAPAENLSAISNESVEVVTTRSVLIYVAAKQQAFSEFYRVLKPHGRLSLFEPINRFCSPEPTHIFWGYDVTPVAEIAQKVKIVYHRIQPTDSDPMLDFDERDLITFAEKTGFKEIHLELQVEIKKKDNDTNWEMVLRTAWNPKIPTLEEAMREALTPTETKTLIAHLRPLVDAKQGVNQSAVAYLWAVK